MVTWHGFERAILLAAATCAVAAAAFGVALLVAWCIDGSMRGVWDAEVVPFGAAMTLVFAAAAYPGMLAMLWRGPLLANTLIVGAVTLLAVAGATLLSIGLAPFVGFVAGHAAMVACWLRADR